MTAVLPPGVKAYKRTPSFDEASVPAALLRDHSTKEGIWGLLHVEQGQLRYVVTDLRRPHSEIILGSDTSPGVIEPTILHHVELLGCARFLVEFYR